MGNFTLLKNKDRKKISSILEIQNDTTVLFKVIGNIYINYFIYDGDILVIDTNALLYDGVKVLVKIADKECIKIYRIIGDFGYLQTSLSTIFPEVIGDLKYEIIGAINRVIHITNTNLMN